MKRRSCKNYLGFFIIIAILVFGFSVQQARAAEAVAGGCQRIMDLRVDGAELISATIVPAGEDLPEYCRVTGYIRPSIHFEIRLPTNTWNEKFYMAGCGGYCGKVDANRPRFTNAPNYGLKRNYAVACTDSGHWGFAVFDGKWAYYDRQKEIDWGYRSIHEVTELAKKIIQTYYGKAPQHSYFAGCSTGGRQAVMEALKYPKDFDGIISGAPALDYTGLVATFFSWLVQANRDAEGKHILDPSKVKLVSEAVYKQCDGKDGLEDGIIQDPRECDFDPSSLLCCGTETENCLTAEEVTVLNKFYRGPKNSQGKQLYPGGLPYGSEPFWFLWVTGRGKGPGLIELFNIDFLKYMAFETDPDSSDDPYNFNFDKDPSKLDFMAEIYNATDPNLEKFKENGGKLIMYQGWSDSIVTPFYTVDYYEKVVDEMGGLEKTTDFFRLFMVPGMDHCSILPGKGPDRFDVLTALEHWVEKGKAPERIIASQKEKDGTVVRTRPIYPYPQKTEYKGSGDVDDADSFTPKGKVE